MDPYQDIAAYYDCEHDGYRDDIDFYLNLIHDGPVLEIGAGTGRVTEALARAGFETWAVDPSECMLARARARLRGLSQTHLIEGDAATLSLPVTFPVALFPLNTLWHLADSRDQVRAIHAVGRHLEPGALLVLDLLNPLSMADRGANGEMRQVYRGRCESGMITRTVAAWDHTAEQILDLAVTYHIREGEVLREVTSEMTLRYVYRSELELMLELAGLIPRQIYGSYDLDPYDRDSDRLIAVCQKP